jgi:hypothetical protein
MPQVTLDLDDKLYWIVKEFCAEKPGRTIEDTLRRLLIYPIYENNFYREDFDIHFPQAQPFTREEADAAFRSIIEPILQAALPENHRAEAVIHGLIRAAYGRALAYCERKGWHDHAIYIAKGFCNELIYEETRARELEAAGL